MTTPIAENWSLDHVGHAVFDLQTAIAFYTKQLGFALELTESLPEHKVETAFLTLANTSIELLQPMPGNTVLNKFLASRGESLHHVCFRVVSVAEEIVRLQSQGITPLDRIPRPGARGTEIAFLHPKSTRGVLIELCSVKSLNN